MATRMRITVPGHTETCTPHVTTFVVASSSSAMTILIDEDTEVGLSAGSNSNTKEATEAEIPIASTEAWTTFIDVPMRQDSRADLLFVRKTCTLLYS
jgi:hypothetical protein